MIPISNAGGNIAHLGGALFGYLYATQLRKGNDIGLWWDRSLDFIVGLFKSKPKTPFKKVYKNPKRRSRQTADESQRNASDQEKINIILEKISKSGNDSSTKLEKIFQLIERNRK